MKFRFSILSFSLLVAGILCAQNPGSHSGKPEKTRPPVRPWECKLEDELVRAAVLEEAQILHMKLFVEAAKLQTSLKGLNKQGVQTRPVELELSERAKRLAVMLGWHDWSLSGPSSTLDPNYIPLVHSAVNGSARVAVTAPVLAPGLWQSEKLLQALMAPSRGLRVPARSYAVTALAWTGYISSGDKLIESGIIKSANTLSAADERSLQNKLGSAVEADLETLGKVLEWTPQQRRHVHERLVGRILRDTARIINQTRLEGALVTKVVLDKFPELDLIQFLEVERAGDATFPVSADHIFAFKEMRRLAGLNAKLASNSSYLNSVDTLGKTTDERIANARGILSFFQAFSEAYPKTYRASDPFEEKIRTEIDRAVSQIKLICQDLSSRFKEGEK